MEAKLLGEGEADEYAVAEGIPMLQPPGQPSDYDHNILEILFQYRTYKEASWATHLSNFVHQVTRSREGVIHELGSGACPGTNSLLRTGLQATKDAGGTRFLFHPDPEIGAPEWQVMSRMCGNPWREDPNGYWPGDTWREDIDGYGTHFASAKSTRE